MHQLYALIRNRILTWLCYSSGYTYDRIVGAPRGLPFLLEMSFLPEVSTLGFVTYYMLSSLCYKRWFTKAASSQMSAAGWKLKALTALSSLYSFDIRSAALLCWLCTRSSTCWVALLVCKNRKAFFQCHYTYCSVLDKRRKKAHLAHFYFMHFPFFVKPAPFVLFRCDIFSF